MTLTSKSPRRSSTCRAAVAVEAWVLIAERRRGAGRPRRRSAGGFHTDFSPRFAARGAHLPGVSVVDAQAPRFARKPNHSFTPKPGHPQTPRIRGRRPVGPAGDSQNRPQVHRLASDVRARKHRCLRARTPWRGLFGAKPRSFFVSGEGATPPCVWHASPSTKRLPDAATLLQNGGRQPPETQTLARIGITTGVACLRVGAPAKRLARMKGSRFRAATVDQTWPVTASAGRAARRRQPRSCMNRCTDLARNHTRGIRTRT